MLYYHLLQTNIIYTCDNKRGMNSQLKKKNSLDNRAKKGLLFV